VTYTLSSSTGLTGTVWRGPVPRHVTPLPFKHVWEAEVQSKCSLLQFHSFVRLFCVVCIHFHADFTSNFEHRAPTISMWHPKKDILVT